VGIFGSAVVALLFPGQGSQYVGMGEDLRSSHPSARAVFEEADDVLGFALSRLCAEGPEADLVATQNAQPAILVHSIAVYRCIYDELGDVAFAAGHSLGEFTAWIAAGSLPFADGLRTVRRRGELMRSSGVERPGTMAALLGLDDKAIDRVCRAASQAGGDVVAANYNAPGQTVISGDVPTVEKAMELAKAAGAKRAIRLNVSGAFHSPLMRVAEAGLAEQLSRVSFKRPAFPVVSNVSAQPVTDPVTARRLLEDQLTSPVRWADSVREMLGAGVTRFIELGPGSVLTGLLRRIDREADGMAVGTADEVSAFRKA
jgi:[acyl-carrier-protein] S-malonyltransferase